jgi:hypothetical protein
MFFNTEKQHIHLKQQLGLNELNHSDAVTMPGVG